MAIDLDGDAAPLAVALQVLPRIPEQLLVGELVEQIVNAPWSSSMR